MAYFLQRKVSVCGGGGWYEGITDRGLRPSQYASFAGGFSPHKSLVSVKRRDSFNEQVHLAFIFIEIFTVSVCPSSVN